jgi:hypothetical protein
VAGSTWLLGVFTVTLNHFNYLFDDDVPSYSNSIQVVKIDPASSSIETIWEIPTGDVEFASTYLNEQTLEVHGFSPSKHIYINIQNREFSIQDGDPLLMTPFLVIRRNHSADMVLYSYRTCWLIRKQVIAEIKNLRNQGWQLRPTTGGSIGGISQIVVHRLNAYGGIPTSSKCGTMKSAWA